MYSAVIVDDEKLVIESLRRSSVWLEEGFDVTGQAQNGIDALKLIADLKPDVVFTDIQMPGMNGLELMQNIDEAQEKPLFVIISGYSEFEYAQKAIALGAVGYCLKPFDPSEVRNILRSVRQKLNRSREEYLLQLSEILNETEPIDDTQLAGILKKMKLEITESSPLIAVTLIGQNVPLETGSLHHVLFRTGARKRVLLVKESMPDQCLEFFRQIPKDNIDGIGLSKPIRTPGQLVDALVESELAAHQYFIYGKGYISLEINDTTDKIKGIISEFSEGIKRKDITELDDIFDKVVKALISENGHIKHAHILYICVMGHLFGKFSEDDGFVFTYQQMAYYYGDFGKMLRELKNSIIKRLQESENDEPVDNGGIIDEAIRIIKTYFYKDISIQSIARDFHINPSYFCSLFKKKTGTNFTAYLNKCRIAYAASLLKESSLPIGEIAEKAGYNNFYYFSKLFKSMMGVTPSRYRASESAKAKNPDGV